MKNVTWEREKVICEKSLVIVTFLNFLFDKIDDVFTSLLFYLG